MRGVLSQVIILTPDQKPYILPYRYLGPCGTQFSQQQRLLCSLEKEKVLVCACRLALPRFEEVCDLRHLVLNLVFGGASDVVFVVLVSRFIDYGPTLLFEG